MGHIKVSATRAERTPAEWLPVGAQIGNLVNTWAGRSDIVAYVGPGAGGPTPACFNPPLAEVEVNVDAAFGKGTDPHTIGDLTQRDTLFNWPKASGAIFHEALHARYSRVNLIQAAKDLTPAELNAFMTLEETRIEKLGIDNFPANRVFLRACAIELVLHDIQEKKENLEGIRPIAGLAGLLSARVDAGVLDSDDIVDITALVIDYLGVSTFEKLRSVWRRFQAHEVHHDTAVPYALAREWEKILQECATERGEDLDKPQKEISSSAIAGMIMEAMEDAASNISIVVGDEVQDQEQSEEWEKEVNNRSIVAKQQKHNRDVAATVFQKGTEEIITGGSSSRLKETRMPTTKERAAAVKIAQMLEKAKYRERDEHEISSILPPGRLRTRAVVQNAAYKAQGSMTRAETWRRTVRKHTDDPTLTVGVMVDISGSMSEAMQPMAVTAWAMSEAARRVQARCAMVYYGADVFPTLKPGQHLSEVNVYTAPDGTEKFDRAFKALDGGLDLLYGTGARLLVVVSDGRYTEKEVEAAKGWLRQCDQNGVAVLWLPFTRSDYDLGYTKSLTAGSGAVLLADVKDPASAALEIGTAAAKALSKIGKKNAA